MRRYLTGITAVILVLATAAVADEWKKTYQLTDTPELRVVAGDGNIRVVTADIKELRATVTTQGWRIGPNNVRIDEHQTGNRIDIQIHVPNVHFSFGNHNLQVDLTVPRAANLDLSTTDGNISADDVKGQLRFASGDGNIDAHRLDGALKASSGDGHIRLAGRFDALDLHTGDGSIDAEVQSGSKMTTGWLVRSGDGNVELRLPANFVADIDVRTGDGHISVDLPVTTSGSVGESRFHGKLNGGGETLELRTGDGNINIRKS